MGFDSVQGRPFPMGKGCNIERQGSVGGRVLSTRLLVIIGFRFGVGVGCVEEFDDGGFEGEGACGGDVAGVDLALRGDDPLFKVPLDAGHHEGGGLLEEAEDGGSIVSVDVELCQDRETCTPLLGKSLDLGVGSWLLPSKLVAREGEDFKLPVCEPFMKLCKFPVVLRGETSFGRHVDNQQHLSFVLCHRVVVSLVVLHHKVVDRVHFGRLRGHGEGSGDGDGLRVVGQSNGGHCHGGSNHRRRRQAI